MSFLKDGRRKKAFASNENDFGKAGYFLFKRNSHISTETTKEISSKRQLDRYDLSKSSLCVFSVALVVCRWLKSVQTKEKYERTVWCEKKSEYADLGKCYIRHFLLW